MTATQPVIEIEHLNTRFGKQWVHRDLDLTVKTGEIMGVVGGSGAGKTTLLRAMLGLLKPAGGSLRILGYDLTNANSQTWLNVQRRWGVLFQQNALFSSLTVLENVMFPLKEHTNLDDDSMKELALLKLRMVGLISDDAVKYPSELSGGMQKRAALARAIILDPELIFLDEPTAGLDPSLASGLDQLILTLRRTMGLTIVIITHDLDSLWTVTDRVAFLGEGKVLAAEPMQTLVKQDNPLIKAFFSGARGMSAEESYRRE